MAQYLKPLKTKVILLACLIFITIGLQLVNPQIIRFFIDTAIDAGASDLAGTAANNSRTTTLFGAALLFLVSSLLLQGLGVMTTYVGEDVGWRSTNQLRADLARHCLRLDMTFHNQRTPGEMIERIDGDVADIAVFFAQFVIRILGNLLLLAGVLVVLLRIDWRVGLVMTVYTAVSLYGLYFIRRIAVPHWKRSREASADLFGFLEEYLSGTEDVRANGAVPYTMRLLFKFRKTQLDAQVKAGTMNVSFSAMWLTMYTIGQIIAFVSGYILFSRGLITIGTVFLIVHYTDIVFRPLEQMTEQIQNLQKAAAGIDRVEALHSEQSKIRVQAGERLPIGPLGVTFDAVSFGYVAAEPVLRDISYHLGAGRVLGLLGRTGSGKTTLARLLFRLYDPTAGSIHLEQPLSSVLDGPHSVDIREAGLHDLRSRIGMVTQDVQLFRATVRDNLTFFNRTISDQRLLNVIDSLGLRPWYETLSDGLDTKLDAEGSSLSAGEGQLLAFTRVFLQDPGLVILDEASSRLDPVTEQLIERAVDRLLENRTGIIIAHRLQTIRRADQIMILRDGRISEQGDRQELAADPTSRFAELLRTGMEEVLA